MNWSRWGKMIIISATGILLAALIVIIAASGALSKAHYLEPWQKTYADKFDDPRVKLSAYGILAANGHNMQPWRIKLDKNKNIFYLYADSERLTKEVDPYARQTMISQGTFLEYVRVAGEKLGYNTDMTLFPDGQYDERNLIASMQTKPVARIDLSKNGLQSSPLYEYMFLPDTNRGSYQKKDLTQDEINKLLSINTDKDMTIKIYQNVEDGKRLGSYANAGAEIESGIHRINKESAEVFRSNEYEKNKYRYGFSVEGQGTSGIMKYILEAVITIIPSVNNEENSAKLYVSSTKTAVENTPAYAMIITDNNSRTEQVKSGMLYSRLVLTAHSQGLVMQPPSQVLEEYKEMSKEYLSIHKDYAPNAGTIQMFFRIGKPTQKFPQSMRQDVMTFIK